MKPEMRSQPGKPLNPAHHDWNGYSLFLRKVIPGFLAFVTAAALAGNHGLVAQQRIAPDKLRAEDVRSAIDNGVQFLLKRRNRNTSVWDDVLLNYAGSGNALVALALLNAGVDPDSREMRAALRALSQSPVEHQRSTYVVSLRLMCMAAAGPAGQQYRRLMEQDAEWLVSTQFDDGGWSYGSFVGPHDFSNSQFALLALHEAALAGIKIPVETWQKSYRYWQSIYNREGSFSYISGGSPGNGASACGGISSLIIIQENLADAGQFVVNGQVVCCREEIPEAMLKSAQSWMAVNFSASRNPAKNGGNDGGKYYYLYGMERAGRLSGQRFFGDHDWYREGAAHLVSDQRLDGSWENNNGTHSEGVPEIASSLALLFLAKGLRPILFGQYALDADGKNIPHPAGIHYLSRQVESAWGMPLNWQTVNAAKADVNDLRECPVLFMSGREVLKLDDRQKQALKRYVESGKFLFVEACQGDGCGDSVPFDKSFRDLMAELFPESALEVLPPDHPVWNANFPIKPPVGWPVLGLQACCRTGVIYCPQNLSCYWQMDREGILAGCPENVRAEVEYRRKLGINVAAYATGRILNEKLNIEKLGDSVMEALPGRALVFPKLRLGGGDDDATSAWQNILDSVASATRLQIDSKKRFVDADFDQMSDYTMLFAHGRRKFSLDEEKRKALRAFIENGGFLFADSICSSAEFADAFRAEMRAIFPDLKLEPVPADHPLWTDNRFGSELTSVTIQHPDAKAPGGMRQERTSPRMEGITLDGRLVVLLSPVDLSCAMENSTASHCEGYVRQDAATIAAKVILYRMRGD